MRWPWSRHRHRESGGTQARQAAEENLEAIRANGAEVSRVAQSLRELRERNHFASQIELIFQGGRKS